MALQKEKDFKYGLKTTYWSIDHVAFDFVNKTSNVIIFGYLSENSKKVDGEQPTCTESFSWSGDDFTFTKTGDNVAEAYAKLKVSMPNADGVETNWFVDAEDC